MVGNHQLIWWDDIWSLPRRNYIVKGLLDEGGLSVIYGPSNSGKTFLTIDMALHVALGREWLGHRVNGGAVGYVAPEGGNGLRERLEAFVIHYGLGGEDVPFALIPSQVDFCSNDTDAAEIAHLIEEAKSKLDLPIRIIVIDTVSRAMHGGDDNSPRDMGAFVANLDFIRQVTGAHVLGVHHTGKDETRGMRGSTVLLGAVDTAIEVREDKSSGLRQAETVKQRDHAHSKPISFRLEPVDLGIDEDGDKITSCVIKPSTEDFKKAPQRLRGNNLTAMEALHEALIMDGKDYTGHRGIPSHTSCINIERWRMEFYARKDGTQETKRKAFQRAKDKLLDIGRVGYRNELVWAINS